MKIGQREYPDNASPSSGSCKATIRREKFSVHLATNSEAGINSMGRVRNKGKAGNLSVLRIAQ